MTGTYDHVQRGIIHYLIALGGAVCLVAAVASGAENPGFIPFVAAAGAMMFVGACFAYLRVSDLGDRLGVRFGPIGLFGTSIRYDEIASAYAWYTTFWTRWGIHGMPFGGVTWNVSGYDCVRVVLKRPHGLFRFKRINIGTDDLHGLAAFLSSKIAPEAAAARTDAP